MILKVRPEDANALEMSDWIALLRDEADGETAGDGGTRPEAAAPATPQAAAPATPQAAAPATPQAAAPATPQAAAPATRVNRPRGSAESAACAEHHGRAVLGDQLRIPIAWCEMGPCISRHRDPAALGEADIRDRALSAGWRVDGLGRLACPDCQQSTPWFWPAQPVAVWDREAALTVVATYLGGDATPGTARARAAVTSAVQPAAIPLAGPRLRGRHRKQR
jgi:hypothetical protein